MEFALAWLSGVFHAISLPGFNLEFLSFVFLIPLIRIITSSSPMMGGVYSSVYFISNLMISHFWLMSTLVRNFSELLGYKPVLGFLTFLLFLLYESAFFFFFGFLVSLFKDRMNEWAYFYIFIPSLYTFIDYLRSLGDLGYTGGMISDAFYKNSLFLFLFSLIGSYGVEFIIVVFNVYFFRKNIRNVMYIIGVFYVVFYLTNTMFTSASSTEGFKMKLYQTNYDPVKRYAINTSLLEIKNNEKENAIIIATPEAFYSVHPIDFKELRSLPNRIFIGTSLEKNGKFYNSVIYKDQDGIQVYSKVKLFPFAEFLPYPRLFRFLSFLKKFHYYNPGVGYTPFEIEGEKIGVLICFETFFEEGAIDYANKNVDFILVSTNDGWFNSRVALWQHYAKACIRAAESGRWVVQVANRGITGVIDSHGKIKEIFPVGVEMQKSVIIGRSHPTLYPRIHLSIPFILLGLLSISLLFVKRRHYIRVSRMRF